MILVGAGAHGILLVFDVTDSKSFAVLSTICCNAVNKRGSERSASPFLQDVVSWLEEIRSYANREVKVTATHCSADARVASEMPSQCAHCCDNVVLQVVLVGNKVDLAHKRVVSCPSS